MTSSSFLSQSPTRPAPSVLYVMHEHPSVSQTFVVLEAAAVQQLGVPVVTYAIHKGRATQPAASVRCLCPPAAIPQLALVAARRPAIVIRGLGRLARQELPARDALRLLFAELHAEYVLPHARRLGVNHVHAHFVARPADVANALAARLGCPWSATAHASDIFVPCEESLLSQNLAGAAFIACANERVRATIASRSPNTPTLLVRATADLRQATYRRPTRRTESRQVVTVGRLVATKGYWTILAAAPSLLQDDSGLTWTVVGDGPLKGQLLSDDELRRLASDSNS